MSLLIEIVRQRVKAVVCFLIAYLVISIIFLTATSVPGEVVLATAVLGIGLVALSVVDVAALRLPDIMTLPLGLIGLLFASSFDWEPSVWSRITSATLAFGLLWFIREVYRFARDRDGLGLGDAKLFAVGGVWVGFDGLPHVLLVACFSALGYVAFCAAIGRRFGRNDQIAFGPFLAAGIWVVWLALISGVKF